MPRVVGTGLGAYLRAFRVVRARARAGERECETRREREAADRHGSLCAAACGAAPSATVQG